MSLSYRIFLWCYYIFCAFMCVHYAAEADMYHLLISIGTLIVPPALDLAHRLLKLRRSTRLNMLILGFTTLAYPLGSCIDLYRRLPGFDKLAHTLSGVFVSILCILLFVLLKPDRQLNAADIPLAIAFTFFGSMAVAGLWEVSEYILSGIVNIDLQRVNATGVADSMQDMIVCMAGTLISLPLIPRLIKGKQGFITASIREFCQLNA